MSEETKTKLRSSRSGKGTGNRNSMANEANRLKVSQSKIGRKRLYKDKEFKQAVPNTPYWFECIQNGYQPQ